MSVNLREERAGLLIELRDVHAAGGTTPTAEQVQEFDRIEARMVELDVLIERGDKVDAREAAARLAAAPTVTEERTAASGAGSDVAEYRAAFDSYIRTGVVTAEELRALSVGTLNKGGYTAPSSFNTTLFESLETYGIMVGLVDSISTTDGNDIEWAKVTARGVAAWTGEGGAYNDSDDTFGTATIGAHKATRTVKVSDELLSDSSVNLDAFIGNSMARSFAKLLNTAILVGDGSSKPTGLLTTVATFAAGDDVTITFNDCIGLQHALGQAYRDRATFVANDATVKLLRLIKDASTDRYIYVDSVREGEPNTLLGRPLVTDVDMPIVAASAKPLLFGDLKSAYMLRNVSTVGVKRLNELYAVSGQVGFVGSIRVDGVQVDDSAAVALANLAS